jgi:hypothetical protein
VAAWVLPCASNGPRYLWARKIIARPKQKPQ